MNQANVKQPAVKQRQGLTEVFRLIGAVSLRSNLHARSQVQLLCASHSLLTRRGDGKGTWGSTAAGSAEMVRLWAWCCCTAALQVSCSPFLQVK